jgi:CMP-N,N'-diacetyllegionaminic acid synthase
MAGLSPWLPLEEQITRRQDKPAVWARNGAAIYLTRTAQLATYILGGKTLAYQMSKLDSIDLDDAEDWEIAEALIARHNVAAAVRRNASL